MGAYLDSTPIFQAFLYLSSAAFVAFAWSVLNAARSAELKEKEIQTLSTFTAAVTRMSEIRCAKLSRPNPGLWCDYHLLHRTADNLSFLSTSQPFTANRIRDRPP
jgi:hypothetical protein